MGELRVRAMARTYVYDFSEGGELGRELLGGKGVGLAEMTAIGLPVPAGFTVTTEACREYMELGGKLPDGLREEIEEHVEQLEETTGKRFGDPSDPLLVSVRSGAAVSMPGMMDTILNLGLNDDAVEGLAAATDNERFAFDAYRRLIQMFGNVVDGIEGQLFERELASMKDERGVSQDVDLDACRPARADEALRRDLRRELGRAVPAGRARAARARRSRRLRLVEHAARAGLPSREPDPGRPGHRGERRPDGLRQQGRRLGHRRGVHPQPLDGEAGDVGRVPRQRPGRGRRRRDPDARADRGHGGALPRGLPAALRHDGAARGALPRDAGHRVHDRGGLALPPADARRKAHRRRGAARRRGHGRRRADLARRRQSRGSTRASSTSCSTR